MFHKERTFIVREVKKNSKSIFLYVSFGIYVHCNLLAMYRPVRMETKVVDGALYLTLSSGFVLKTSLQVRWVFPTGF